MEDILLNEVKFHHGPLAALYLKEKNYLLSEEGFNAIACHTLLRRNYTMFEALIYLVDKIELGRGYSDVKNIRKALAHDLNLALLLCREALQKIYRQRGKEISKHDLDINDEVFGRLLESIKKTKKIL